MYLLGKAFPLALSEGTFLFTSSIYKKSERSTTENSCENPLKKISVCEQY